MRTLWTPWGEVPVSAVGLDVDGVMRDTNIIAHRSLERIITHFGGTAPSYGQHICKDFDHVLYCRKHGATIEDLAAFRKVYYEVHPPDKDTPPFPDVADFCRQVAALGLNLFVVSSCREDWLVPWFEEHSLGAHFAYIVHTARPKEPHIADICAQLGVEPRHVMYVGDMVHDVHAAKAVGAVPVGVTRGHEGAKDALYEGGAQLVTESLEHLAQLIT